MLPLLACSTDQRIILAAKTQPGSIKRQIDIFRESLDGVEDLL
jgi:hypothetical protein